MSETMLANKGTERERENGMVTLLACNDDGEPPRLATTGLRPLRAYPLVGHPNNLGNRIKPRRERKGHRKQVAIDPSADRAQQLLCLKCVLPTILLPRLGPLLFQQAWT